MVHYIDTSALVKLVVAEHETGALLAWIDGLGPELVACDLARTELLRAVRRTALDRLVQARTVLDSIAIVSVRTTTFETAGRLEPAELRTLDALHVAAALEFGDELAGIVTYDDRFAEAARRQGLTVIAPA